MGPALSYVLEIPTVGSVSEVGAVSGLGIFTPRSEITRIFSKKWVVATPTRSGIKISDQPPNFRLLLIIIKQSFRVLKT